MKITSVTDPGCKKTVNEDTVILHEGRYPIFGIADGMGGHVGGAIASAEAAKTMIDTLAMSVPNEEDIRAAFRKANMMLLDMQREDRGLNGMGTTLTVIWCDEHRAVLGHVGDSRAYLLRDDKLTQLTRDHSLVNDLILQGSLTPEEARVHPYRNMITRAVGTEPGLDVDVDSFELKTGDRFLICSDGLTEYFEDPDILSEMNHRSIKHAAERMLAEVLRRGGHDNISIVIAEVEA